MMKMVFHIGRSGMERIVNILFKWGKLREALMSEVHMYDQLGRLLNDPDSMKTGSLYWPSTDGWRGWTHNEDLNKYFFNDIPEHGLSEAMQALNKMEGAITLE